MIDSRATNTSVNGNGATFVVMGALAGDPIAVSKDVDEIRSGPGIDKLGLRGGAMEVIPPAKVFDVAI